MSGKVWTIGSILKWTEQYFRDKGVDSPRLDAEVLLSHVLKKERIYLYVHFDEPLEQEEQAAYRELIKKRVQGIPTAYLIGQREFMGLPFLVTEDTLIPRPDTEILVQAAVDFLRRLADRGRDVEFADIGTGTGAICLSVLRFLPAAHAATVDISEKARRVAEENARRLEVSDRVEFFTGDLLKPLEGRTFDAILSNPPYISEMDMQGLSVEVRNEPRLALFGGRDGMDFYRRLCADAPRMLKEGGFLAFEVGIHQAKEVERLAKANPQIGRTEVRKDLAGINRVVLAWKAEG